MIVFMSSGYEDMIGGWISQGLKPSSCKGPGSAGYGIEQFPDKVVSLVTSSQREHHSKEENGGKVQFPVAHWTERSETSNIDQSPVFRAAVQPKFDE